MLLTTVVFNCNSQWYKYFSMSMSSLEGDDDDDYEDDESTAAVAASSVDASHQTSPDSRMLYFINQYELRYRKFFCILQLLMAYLDRRASIVLCE